MVNIGYFYLTFGEESCGLLPEKFSGLHLGHFKIATQVESYLVTEYVVANMSFFSVTFVSIGYSRVFKLLLCTYGTFLSLALVSSLFLFVCECE